MGRRSGRRAVAALALVVGLAPGCRTVARGAGGFYDVAADVFAPNPATIWPFFGGLGLGFVAGLPLCLLTWPCALVAAHEDDLALASLAPAVALGTFVGGLLAAPLWPFGVAFEPDEPAPLPGPGPGEATPPAAPVEPDDRGRGLPPAREDG
jgi:hypothetical protein